MAKLWEFKTKNFAIVLTAEDEWDVDVSWDETGQVAVDIERGDLEVFCAKVAVYFDGREIGSDYLGQCIYRDPAEFATQHRDPNPMNRNCSIMRAERGNVSICHYFPGMVSEAISNAREFLDKCSRRVAA